MCTVIITVPDNASDPVRLLAVRDEDPGRQWDRLGAWWPDAYPGVVGIRDARAGGAWLAADAGSRRLAVLLNRRDLSDRPDSHVQTRGTIALEAVAGRPPSQHPSTRGFNLVEVTAHTARVVSWNGLEAKTVELPPGTHMIAHDEVDDATTARIAQWLPDFRDAAPEVERTPGDAEWWRPWLSIVERSAQVPGTDETAIIRRQSFEGIPSYSLLIAVATVSESALDVRDAPLSTPGEWGPVTLG
ncbi:MAG TPA: NRDE family protein [Microbacterium sp.]|nr:NRDE family protein [Microbacterium sp.]